MTISNITVSHSSFTTRCGEGLNWAYFKFNAINLTIGLPFLRISPDHGPNNKMIGKNSSDPQSLINAIKFLNRNS